MSFGQIVPIGQRNRKLPVMGRLRFGKQIKSKNGKMRPVAVDKWILTSNNKRAIEQLRDVYGGTIAPFAAGPAGTLQLETDTSTIRVVLPAEPLEDSFYERWSGGGLLRKCDGETMKAFPKDGSEPFDKPCECRAVGLTVCAPKTRLSVIIPDVGLGGIWRMDTGSEYALDEIPASVELIQAVSTRGFPEAELSLTNRQTASGNHKFVVPMLSAVASFDALTSGAVSGSPALGPGTHSHALDAHVVDAEVIDDDEWNG